MNTFRMSTAECMESSSEGSAVSEEVISSSFYNRQGTHTLNVKDIGKRAIYSSILKGQSLPSSKRIKYCNTILSGTNVVSVETNKIAERTCHYNAPDQELISTPTLEVYPNEFEELLFDINEGNLTDFTINNSSISGSNINNYSINGSDINKTIDASSVGNHRIKDLNVNNHSINCLNINNIDGSNINNLSFNGLNSNLSFIDLNINNSSFSGSNINHSRSSANGMSITTPSISGTGTCVTSPSINSTSKADVTIMALKSTKTRNPPYLLDLDKNTITTDNYAPVKFMVKGAKAGMMMLVSLRFAEPMMKQSPVTPCNEHSDKSIWQNQKAPKGFTFYTTTDQSEYSISSKGHPTAEVPVQDSESGNFEFSVVFLCLNFCHRKKSKTLDLLVNLVDSTRKLLEEKCFTLRVCKNPLRDHKDLKPNHSNEEFNDKNLKQGSKESMGKKPLRLEKLEPVEPMELKLPTNHSQDLPLEKIKYKYIGLPEKDWLSFLPLLAFAKAECIDVPIMSEFSKTAMVPEMAREARDALQHLTDGGESAATL